MIMEKTEFNDFIATVPAENQDFVKELHDRLMEHGCKIEIKTAKSGYMVSYIYNSIQKAPICKRMADPNACNPRCSMGYDFWMKGEHYQKCRSSAFMFLACPENNPFIRTLLLNEVKAWEKSNYE